MSTPLGEIIGSIITMEVFTVQRRVKKIPAEELGNSLFQFEEFGYDPVLIWSPVIEEDFGHERFLPEHPVKLIEEGSFAEIPIIMEVTKDEFANRAFPIVANATLLNELSDHFETYAPVCFIYERDTDKFKE
ncbi:COesterase domain containing protein, partial [Asbolus verrucosus]